MTAVGLKPIPFGTQVRRHCVTTPLRHYTAMIYSVYLKYLTTIFVFSIYISIFSDDRHPYFKPGKPKEDEQEEEDLNDANYDEVTLQIAVF